MFARVHIGIGVVTVGRNTQSLVAHIVGAVRFRNLADNGIVTVAVTVGVMVVCGCTRSVYAGLSCLAGTTFPSANGIGAALQACAVHMSANTIFKAAGIISAVIIGHAYAYVHAGAMAVYAVFIRAAMVVAGSAVGLVRHQIEALGPAPGKACRTIRIVVAACYYCH